MKKILFAIFVILPAIKAYSQHIDTSSTSINSDIYHTGGSIILGDTIDDSALLKVQNNNKPIGLKIKSDSLSNAINIYSFVKNSYDTLTYGIFNSIFDTIGCSKNVGYYSNLECPFSRYNIGIDVGVVSGNSINTGGLFSAIAADTLCFGINASAAYSMSAISGFFDAHHADEAYGLISNAAGIDYSYAGKFFALGADTANIGITSYSIGGEISQAGVFQAEYGDANQGIYVIARQGYNSNAGHFRSYGSDTMNTGISSRADSGLYAAGGIFSAQAASEVNTALMGTATGGQNAFGGEFIARSAADTSFGLRAYGKSTCQAQ